MKKLCCAVSMVTILISSLSWADSQVRPPNGTSWGDPNGTANLLQMTKDPDAVTKTTGGLGIKVAQTCKDSQGNSLLPKDPGFDACMAEAQRSAVNKGSQQKNSAGVQIGY